ncbi:ATP-binding cassette domain-containing protein [Alteromonas sp. 5E99-2]|uniref:ATP-binding cassette domain-containing protein n=1 Tax=Alteromonas sp. 5E99-2 TaxID=2817683 RepID=UPI001A980231|nr:ATP-binding cassette domain-containing protein [Alteromonas sp. 5E99-2]MBO1256847.1 ATP-binding cassette domain-containing protein [Alteromonas sp. 5E99-2]
MIQLQSLSLRRGTKHLLKDANATIYPGHRVGLIGRNGCGKSSLFALLRKELDIDEGDLQLPTQWKVVSVAQETPASSRSAIDYVIDGDTHLRQLQKELALAESKDDGVKIGALHAKLAESGAYDIEPRAATILSGLGFSQSQLRAPVSDFSGGWRMRLNLAQALLCPSDLLLLDEPTNHLDLDAVIWLEKWLQQYTGTLLLISHDKAFIDQTVNQILSVEQQTLVTYTGNYSSFETQRAERARLQNIEFGKQQQKVAHLQSFITRFKAKASKAKQAQSRIKQLEKMETLMPAHQDSQFHFSFLDSVSLPSPLVSMEHIELGYGDKTVLEQVKLNLVPGSRIGLLGRNGQGKSTLIKLLASELTPMQGDFNLYKGCQIGYFAQHQLETLDPESSALEHLQRLDKKASEQTLRDFLGGFNFNGDNALSPVAPMSGGEKARLVLAILVYQKPNLLLLDEPTNHLDLDMRHALTLALQNFEGAMVLVSHDRFLLGAVCEDFYLVDNKKVQPFSGDLDDYKQWILSANTQDVDENTSANASASPSVEKTDRKTEKRLQAELRKKLQPFKNALKKAETSMTALSADMELVEAQLAESDVYEKENKETLTKLLKQQGDLSSRLQEAEMAWLDAQEALDSLESEAM